MGTKARIQGTIAAVLLYTYSSKLESEGVRENDFLEVPVDPAEQWEQRGM